MKAFFLECAVCGSLDSERIAEGHTNDDPFGVIVICRQCGFIYRNPVIPHDYETKAGSLGVDGEAAVRAIARNVKIGRGDVWLDIGSGSGVFAAELHRNFPDVEAVLVEPNIAFVESAKRHNPSAAVLPSVIWEADLPDASFALVTVRRTDHFFPDHRHEIERIRSLMKESGVLYIERGVFVEALAGSKAGNTWFGREQFVEYLSELFDVFDRVDYVDGGIGIFCRRVSSKERPSEVPIASRYAEHLAIVRGSA